MTKVIKYLESSSICTWWNADLRSCEEKIFESFNASRVSSICGIGYESIVVSLVDIPHVQSESVVFDVSFAYQHYWRGPGAAK